MKKLEKNTNTVHMIKSKKKWNTQQLAQQLLKCCISNTLASDT